MAVWRVIIALHSVDKNSDDRGSPRPNSHDLQGVARLAAGTTSVHPVTDATTTVGFTQSKNGRILVNDGSNNRAILGVQTDNSVGLIVSKAGFDADPTAPANLIFNSSQDVFKIVKKDTINITAPALEATSNGVIKAENTATYTHNLGYTPAVIAFLDYSGSYVGLPGEIGSAYSANNEWGTQTVYLNSITSTTVQFLARSILWRFSSDAVAFSAQTATIIFYLLQETAS